jgi:hypothetical protein
MSHEFLFLICFPLDFVLPAAKVTNSTLSISKNVLQKSKSVKGNTLLNRNWEINHLSNEQFI